MSRAKGFSLIELLVVIAIIGVLAAIIFPVFARAKNTAYRASDMTHMNEIRTALQLYRADQGAYPPAILGYATLYQPGPDVVPANQVSGKLFPRRIESIETLRPALNRQPLDAIIPAVWPPADPRPVGDAPILDLNHDGAITSADDLADARQAYSLAPVMRPAPVLDPFGGRTENVTGSSDPSWPAYFYRVSGYDVAEVSDEAGGTRWELRYTLFWTGFSLNGQGSIYDDPRQLGYDDPPEGTVVTWNSFYRDYAPGGLQRNRNDIVLFLGGNARPYDSVDVATRSWRILP